MGRRRDRAPRILERVAIEKLSHEGRGIGRVDGKTVFVFGALPGEVVSARVSRRRATFDEAETLDVLEPSPRRRNARCAHFGVCGGCAMQHLDEADQLGHKQSVLLELFEREGVSPADTLPPIRGPQWAYRRKARLGLKHVPKKGGVIVGFRERGKPYVTDARECPVLDARIGDRLEQLRAVVQDLSTPARIPQAEIACGDADATVNLRHLEPLQASDYQRLERFAADTGLSVYLQSGGVDTITPLSGPAPRLAYRVDDMKLEFQPQDFTQVNADINRQLVAWAIAALEPQPADTVADLFCGIGNFSLPLARRAGRVVGVEGDAGLTARAAANAAANGIDNTDFMPADLESPTTAVIEALAGCNKALLDPPRSGAATVVAELLPATIERLVYVSCGPASLARDAAELVRQGFHLRHTRIADMFPQTAHVESVSLFVRD